MVVVYSRPGCSNCQIAKTRLFRAGVEYVEADFDKAQTELVEQYGNIPRSLPILETNKKLFAFNDLNQIIADNTQ